MTDAQRTDFDRQAQMWRKRADAQRGVISHVVWRDGRMDATISPREHARPEPDRPASRRGCSQGQLI